MDIQHQILKIKTKHFLQFLDITSEVERFISKSKIKHGAVLVYAKHTTVAVRINEQEQGLFKDFHDLTHRITPKDIYYRHNDLSIRTENLVCDPNASDCLNGHSHCLHLLLSTSETLPVVDGKSVLGTYQRIFIIELDCSRKREIVLQIMGKT